MEYVLTFNNSSIVIRAENLLLSVPIKAAAMPVPPAISSGCGIALRISENDLENALAALEGKIRADVYAHDDDGGFTLIDRSCQDNN